MGKRPRRIGIGAEFVLFLRHNRKWWLAPILLFVLFLMAVAILGASGVAPLMYTLF